MMRDEKRQLKYIHPDNIQPNEDNPRLIFRQEEMDTLLRSISNNGIQVPISVYKDGDNFTLIDGERRWRCATKLNLRSIPAVIQTKPTKLDNLLLMYNIHALREQWDYFTIATNLKKIIDLYSESHGDVPNEIKLSDLTGLTRGQIRRCNLLIQLPESFQDLLLEELELPKSQQRLSEDFFIEMEKALKTVTKRFPEYDDNLDEIRSSLIEKFQSGRISSVTDFRMLAKIATSVDNLDYQAQSAKKALGSIFSPESDNGIRDIYEETVQFDYLEQRAERHIEALFIFFDQALEGEDKEHIDDLLRQKLSELVIRIQAILGDD